METHTFLDGLDVKQEWNYVKNKDIQKYSKGSHQNVWWICKKDKHHEWQTTIGNRIGQHLSGCPICSNKKICPVDSCNSLYFSFPYLREEWSSKNEKKMTEYTPGSSQRVWWTCKKDKHHEWQAIISNRTGQNSNCCPICINQKICPIDACNSLYFSHPYLREEWNNKNEKKMTDYASGCNKKIWWLCKKDKHHEWQSSISSRTRTIYVGCPICSNRKICPVDACNSLYFSHPKLRPEWSSKNESMKNYPPNSGKKVWWICKNNHEWIAVINNRTSKTYSRNCPRCRTSKLQLELRSLNDSFFNTAGIILEEEKRHKNTRNIFELPFDGHLTTSTSKTVRIELQGEPHFIYSKFFHKTVDKFYKRLQTDNHKSLCTLQSSDSFLSISYLCLKSLGKICKEYFEELEKCYRLFRYYITPTIYLEYKLEQKSSKTPLVIDCFPEKIYNNEILAVYQIYHANITALDAYQKIKNDFHVCDLCDLQFTEECMWIHYFTEQHQYLLNQRKHELMENNKKIFSITLDGIGIILDEDES